MTPTTTLPSAARIPLASGLLAAVLSAAPALSAQEAETHRLSGDRVSVFNLAGSAEITSHSGSEVLVEVRRRGADGELLRVEVDEIGGRESLRVRYPGDRVVYREGRGRSSMEIDVTDRGTFFDERGGDEVRVSTYGDGTEAWADLRIRVPEGTDLTFHLALGETRVEGVSGRLVVDVGSGGVRTRDTRGFLLVDTGSGSVEVREAEGEVEVDTGSGSVEVTDIRGERLLVDTGSGSVRGDAVDVGTLRVDTGSGSVQLGRVGASDIVVDTGSGSVALELVRDVDELVVDTGSGSVELRIPEELGARIEIDTGSGGIETDVPVRIRSARRSHLEGEIGDGRGRIRVDTGSGGVRIRGG